MGNDTSDINISAGIGPFDPNPTALAVYEDQAVIEFPRLVQGLFRDDKVTYRASPVSAECKEVKKNCSSFLLSGGMGAVKPWPFIGTELLSLDAPQYTITNAPSYHIDFWWAPALDSWGSNDCHLYGANDYRFQLCIKLIDREKGVLLVGKYYSLCRILLLITVVHSLAILPAVDPTIASLRKDFNIRWIHLQWQRVSLAKTCGVSPLSHLRSHKIQQCNRSY